MSLNEFSVAPLAIVRPAKEEKASLRELGSRYRIMRRQHRHVRLQQAYERGKALHDAKELCIAEGAEWGRWLKKEAEESERTAQKYLRVFNNWDKISGITAVSADIGLEEVLIWLADVEAGQCRWCRLNPPGKRNCAGCKAEREKRKPGEPVPDPYEKKIKTTDEQFRKAFGNLLSTRVVTEERVNEGYRHLEGLLTIYRECNEAPRRPAPEPKQVDCKRCRAAVLLLKSEKKNRWMTLDAEPSANGDFAIRENRAVHVKLGQTREGELLYKNHFLHCHGRKK